MLNSPAPFFPPPSLSFHFLDPFPCRPPSFHPYHARNLGSTVNCSSGVPPVPPLLSYSPCPAHPSLPWSVLLTPSGGLGSAVNSPRGVRGRAPTANAFRYILSHWNVSGGNDFGCFSCEPKCNWSGSSFYVSRGTSTPLPLHEAPMIGLRHGYWLKSLINVTDVSL